MKIGIKSKIAHEVYRAARSARRSALCLNGGTTWLYCSEASYNLCRLLKQAHFVEGSFITEHDKEYPIVEGHCWVRIGRHILDVTADQFNNKIDNGTTMAAIVFGTEKQLDNRYIPKI